MLKNMRYLVPQPPIQHVQHLEVPVQFQLAEFWHETFSLDCQTHHTSHHHPEVKRNNVKQD